MHLPKRCWSSPRRGCLMLLVLVFTTICVPTSLSALQAYIRHRYDEEWNLFYYLGGNGPWIARKPSSHALSRLPPDCTVQQAHLLSRHAERYPTRNAGSRHIALLTKLQTIQKPLRGSLAFLNNWTYFVDIDNPAFGNLTRGGLYAGVTQAFRNGKKLRGKYSHLLTHNSTPVFWSCASPRDIETAKSFANGFFGQSWESTQRAHLIVIPETTERGANTLTPSDTCINYQKDAEQGHQYGYKMLAQWQKVFSRKIAQRLQEDAGGLEFTPIEVYSMMELCGFEILARDSSPWCDVFTREEWLQFEYARDLLHFYRAGPGNKYAGAMGWLWLNATQSILSDDMKKGVYFSFVHDSDIVAVITSMGILDEPGVTQKLPTSHIETERRWRTSDIIPMSGYIVLEKIQCGSNSDSASQTLKGTYVRLLINDGLFDLNEVVGSSNLAASSSVQQFEEFVRGKGQRFGDYRKICGLSSSVPGSIEFLQ